MWRRIFCARDRDAGETIVEIDWHTGRVVRIPGVYPWRERLMRYKPAALIALALALFLWVGLAQSAIL